MICGSLLKHSKVIMAKKLALSQKANSTVVGSSTTTGMLNSMYNVVRVIGGSDPINSV